jgi:hypothetical protein
MNRTNVDFSQHKLITEFSNNFKMWKLKKPNTVVASISFVNTQGVCLVTGDFGNFVFCREYHPNVGGYVSDHYWCEKYRIATEHQTHEWDYEATRQALQSGIDGELEEYGYIENQLTEMQSYYRTLLQCTDLSEQEYLNYAYQKYIPNFITSEDVPFCEKIKYRFLIVFDAFEEICNRLTEINNNEI